jgi:glycine oxidase
MKRCLVVGGGVMGLSVAYELGRRGWQVCVVDRQSLGKEASWAGAGILPPANAATALHSLDQLRALSNDLHAEWSRRLLAETCIDTGYRRCGGLYLARTGGEAAALAAMAATLDEERIACRRLSSSELMALEPGLEQIASSGELRAAYELPDECQLRNPRHLKALVAACQQLGVELVEDCEVTSLPPQGGAWSEMRTTRGGMRADVFVVTSGAWTQRLLAERGIATGIFPMRGQMVLFRCDQPPLRRVLNEGSRYLVPREDGYVLAGSTEEEAGFDKSTTPEAIEELTAFATGLGPAIKKATTEQTWAGLRPASFDGFPYVGRVPGVDNAFVAAGHFRSGLHLSTGTALVLAQLISGQTPQIDLAPFRVSRG